MYDICHGRRKRYMAIKPRKTITPQTRWTPLHTTVLMHYSEGKTKEQIAEETGMAQTLIARIANSIQFKRRLAEVTTKVVDTVVRQRSEVLDGQAVIEARRILTEASINAALTMVKLAGNPDAKSRVQLEACKDILDRAGLRPIIVTETRERVYSPEEIAGAKAVLEETQAIIERLSTQTSPFVLSDISQGKLESSVTDQGSDDSTASHTP